MRNWKSGYNALLGPTVAQVPFFPLPLANGLPLIDCMAMRCVSNKASGISVSG